MSLAERNVLVNAICPGVFPSRMTAFGLQENKDVLEGIQPTGEWSVMALLQVFHVPQLLTGLE